MKIKANKDYYKGRTITTNAGDVTFNDDGEATVDDKHEDVLKDTWPNFEFTTGDSAKKQTSKKKDAEKDEEEPEEGATTPPPDDELDQLPDEDLKEMALAVEGAPKKKVNAMNREALLAFIRSNMQK